MPFLEIRLVLIASMWSVSTSASITSPTYNSASVAGVTKIIDSPSIGNQGSGSMYTSIWVLPNISGAHNTVSATFSGGNNSFGFFIMAAEVQNLLGSLSADITASSIGDGSSNANIPVVSGNPTHHTNELVMASVASFDGALLTSLPGAPWTNVHDSVGDSGASFLCDTSYQIDPAQSKTYSFTTVSNGSNRPYAWALATFYDTKAPTPGLMLSSII